MTTTIESLRIVVRGIPQPQGSKTAVGHGKSRRVIEDNPKVKGWREDVADSARIAIDGLVNWIPLDEPVLADMIFTFDRPRSHYYSGRSTSHLLRPDAPTRPIGPPDLDKLARAIGDSLKTARILRDDSRIVEYGRLAKVYAASGDAEALSGPGVLIRIRPLR